MDNLYSGLIIKESLTDPSILEDMTVTHIKVTNDANPADRWTIYSVETSRDLIIKIAEVIKPHLWFADFQGQGNVIVVFTGKVFEFRKGDEKAYNEVVAYGLAVGIPRKQLNFDWK